MPFVQWSDECRLGVEEIDTQHRRFYGLVNELYDAMAHGQGTALATEILNLMVSFAVEHFTAEESLMQIHRYPGLPEHRAAHQEFLAKVEEFRTALHAGKLTLNVELLQFLRSWAAAHVEQEDKKLAAALNAVGVH
jgi:hemerythrin-like metal-binding protein